MHTEPVREKLFNMRMSVDEWDRLDRLAKHYGLNAASMIRMLVMDRERELGLTTELPAKKPAKGKR
jgi:hypothetical protein